MEPVREKKCVVCGAPFEDVPEEASGEFRCPRCGTSGRYDDVNLVAMFIPGFHRRLMELESRNRELIAETEMEGMKGESRNMRYLQEKHKERQNVLGEYSFLTHFSDFIDRW